MSDGGNWFFDPEHTSQVNNLPGIGDTGEPAYDDPFYWGANLNSSLACDNIGFDFTVYGTGSYAGNHNGTITVRDGGSITGGSLNALYVDGGDDMNIAESYINGTVSIYSMSHNPYARLRVNGEFSQLTIASNASDLRLTAGNIIVDGGTVSIESCSGGSIGVASGSCTGNFSSANVTITGGSLSGTLDNATIYVTSSGHLVDGTSSGGVLTMDGGEITAGDWTGLSSATVTGGKISGGSFNEVNFTWPAYISSGNGGPTITSATGSGLQVYSDANQVFWMDDTATVAMPSDLVTGYYDISIISSVQIVNMEWNFKNLTIYDTGWQVLEIGSGGKLNLSGASEFSVVLNGGEIGSGDFTAASPTFTAGTISGGHYDITAVPLGITWAGGTTVSPITYNYGIITGGSFAATYETAFENSGTISGGSFEDQGFSTINNNVDCAITGGDFYCHVYNVGAISGGSFSSTVDNDYTIAGGTFSSQVANSGNITDGTFLGAVTNDEYNGGRVTGGTFEGGLSGCDLFFYPATGKGWNDIDVWKIDADGVTAADHLPNQYYSVAPCNNTISQPTITGEAICASANFGSEITTVAVNGGKVLGGDWSSPLLVDASEGATSGEIADGTFRAAITGGGTISGGMFTTEGSVGVGLITGGQFEGVLTIGAGCSMNGGYQTDQAISCSNAGHIGGAATLYNVNNTGLIDGGTLHGDTENHGHVAGGVFDNLRLYSGSTIDAGTFVGSVTVMGEMVLTFSSGTMANAVTVNDGGEIAGGTYSGTVALHGTISGGTFNGAVTANSVTGNIAGGTFANLVLANGPTLGIMAARPSYVCTLNQVTFTPAPPAADYPAEADVRSGVQFDSEAKTGTCKVPAAADVRKDTPVDATVGTLVATGGEAGINGSQILGMI